jgi:hypothetical protein
VKIVAVVGSGSGCGKTTVICRILQAIPGLGAVKISPREGVSHVEWGRGRPGKDTDLFFASGAAHVARIVGPRNSVVRSWELIKDSFEMYHGVIVEGSRSLDFPGEIFVIFVAGARWREVRQKRNRYFYQIATLIVESSSHKYSKNSLKYAYLSHIKNSSDQADIVRKRRISISEQDGIEAIRGFLSI